MLTLVLRENRAAYSLSPLPASGERVPRAEGPRRVRGDAKRDPSVPTFFFEFLQDHCQYTLAIDEHVRIPEPQNTISPPHEVRVPDNIPCALCVLATIQFDD